MENTLSLADQSGTKPAAVPPAILQPVARTERVQTIDIIRGVALLGILMMNIPYFGLPHTHDRTLFNLPAESTDYKTYMVVSILFEGTMRALFSMLFGAGILLFTAKKGLPDSQYTVADFYFRRMMWLIVFGLFNAYILLWPGDILFNYGIAGILLFAFRKLKPSSLFIAAFLCVAILFGKEIWKTMEQKDHRQGYLKAVQLEKQKKKLTDEQKKEKEAWLAVEKQTKPDKKEDAEIIKNRQSNYGAIFLALQGVNIKRESTKLYQFLFWDAIAMMFFGMALFKLGFFTNQLPTRTYAITLLAGYGLGIPLAYLAFRDQVAWYSNPGQVIDTQSFSFQALYQVRRCLEAVGHASLLLLVYRSGVVPWLMKALGNVGQMAFTNYLMQSIICTIFFFGYGFGYFGKLAYHQLYYVVAAVWAFQLVFSVVWLRYFRFGPFEWLWRSLTYWKPQPMRLQATESDVAAVAP
ncbi:DUF418 domain-containing protein [Nibrella saemangeumensis]|uniref:DUF418 domain-containing protein n=1 Tax=Nibrella saemangeumensis TaxID=1084526 RepID=A0ABP8NPV6_9BACT